MKRLLIIFGAQDIEANATIERLRNSGHILAVATADGRRCHPGNAYKATGYEIVAGEGQPEGIVLFECALPAGELPEKIVLTPDHHFPGHAGFGKPASEFWKASAMGQLFEFLGIEPTQEEVCIAAADHCLTDAYAGKCPGIKPEEVLAVRLPEVAQRAGCTETEAYRGIQESIAALKSAKKVQIGGVKVADVRMLGTNAFLTEAGTMTSLPYVGHADTRDKKKINLSGPAKMISGFLGRQIPNTNPPQFAGGRWARRNKITNLYGAPTRGFAGGTIE